jgi:hypothetical protein
MPIQYITGLPVVMGAEPHFKREVSPGNTKREAIVCSNAIALILIWAAASICGRVVEFDKEIAERGLAKRRKD